MRYATHMFVRRYFHADAVHAGFNHLREFCLQVNSVGSSQTNWLEVIHGSRTDGANHSTAPTQRFERLGNKSCTGGFTIGTSETDHIQKSGGEPIETTRDQTNMSDPHVRFSTCTGMRN